MATVHDVTGFWRCDSTVYEYRTLYYIFSEGVAFELRLYPPSKKWRYRSYLYDLADGNMFVNLPCGTPEKTCPLTYICEDSFLMLVSSGDEVVFTRVPFTDISEDARGELERYFSKSLPSVDSVKSLRKVYNTL